MSALAQQFLSVTNSTFNLNSTKLPLGFCAVFISFLLIKAKFRSWRTAHPRLRGPKPNGLLLGSFSGIVKYPPGVAYERWFEEYGDTAAFIGPLGAKIILSTDPKALNHVLTHSDIYQKPPISQYVLGRFLGNGLVLVEGEQHRQQRKVMNPAFGPAQIRGLTDVFVDKAVQLRELCAAVWLNKLALDVIGVAGFNRDLGMLTPNLKPTELSEAVDVLLSMGTTLDPISLLRGFFPALRVLPFSVDRKVKAARAVVDRIAIELINTARERVQDNEAKDLISLLVKESTTVDEKERMSDADILCQIPTFLAAGSDTTSAAASWALFALSTAPRVRSKLRAELLETKSDRPTMDELNALPYLDAVVRETLRLHSPVSGVPKYAVKDDVIPLSTPVLDRDGKLMREVVIRKGNLFTVPILPMNRKTSIWGEDANEFRPERWESLPDEVKSIPALWSNLMTFIAGPRSCIGFRFAITELKAVLFILVRTFEFELAVPKEEIVATGAATFMKPTTREAPKGVSHLPMLVRPVGSS